MSKINRILLGLMTLVVLLGFVGGTGSADDDLEMITVTVDSKATGGFGPLLGGNEPNLTVHWMVSTIEVEEGDLVNITATGTVFLNLDTSDGNPTDPDGRTDLPRGGGGEIYFPLEEVIVDEEGLEALPAIPVNVGALMGAVVDPEDFDGQSFEPRNNDPDPNIERFGNNVPSPSPSGDIPSDSLFLIGSSSVIEAPHDGILWLGINDAFTPNNDGEFVVTVTILGDKVDICHKPGTPAQSPIRVAKQTLTAHLAHGDEIGTCEE